MITIKWTGVKRPQRQIKRPSTHGDRLDTHYTQHVDKKFEIFGTCNVGREFLGNGWLYSDGLYYESRHTGGF